MLDMSKGFLRDGELARHFRVSVQREARVVAKLANVAKEILLQFQAAVECPVTSPLPGKRRLRASAFFRPVYDIKWEGRLCRKNRVRRWRSR